jgi:tight adherence protein C
MNDGVTQALTAFMMASSLTVLIFLLLTRPKDRLDNRLRELSRKGAPDPDALTRFTTGALPKMGIALMPRKEEERTKLQTRLLHAGLYGRSALSIYLGVKLLLMVGPLFLGFVIGMAGLVPVSSGIIFGALLGMCGMIGPSFWLDQKKARRQIVFRRSLPDALDVLVICLEGGLSLQGALKRVANELQAAHPLLARELLIVEREIQMGQPTGDAMRHFGERADLEEVLNLASVITQSERFGSSVVKALRVHAEILREKRLQRAEEMAQRAGTKVLFPTLLFIFPGVFIVLLGPAVIQILEMFENMSR